MMPNEDDQVTEHRTLSSVDYLICGIVIGMMFMGLLWKVFV